MKFSPKPMIFRPQNTFLCSWKIFFFSLQLMCNYSIVNELNKFFLRAVCCFAIHLVAISTTQAQLFDDMEKKQNVSSKTWVIGGDVGVLLAYYTIDNDYPINEGFLGNATYFSPGFHFGGVVLRSFDGLKVGGAVSFQSFSGSSDLSFRPIPGSSSPGPDITPFREVSLNALNLSARGEFAFMSSVDGGFFGIFEVGVSILSGDFPGASVSPPIRGGFGAGYEIRLTDTTNLQVGYLLSYSRFRNEWGETELTHTLFSNTITVGLRF